MNSASLIAPGMALVWGGVSIGGSLVAAPAKFRAPSLDLPTALEVGRAQFQWIGITEAILCALLLLGVYAHSSHLKWLLLIPVVIFTIQWLAIMPLLDIQTLKTIAGNHESASSLHIIYVSLEIMKAVSLLSLAFLIFKRAIA